MALPQPHPFVDDGSGLSGTCCPLGPTNKVHRVALASVPTPMAMDALPPTGLHQQSTSHAAAAKAIARYGTVRHHVLSCIDNRPAGHGATDDELEVITGRSHQSLSACRNSLMNDGLIEPTIDAAGEQVKRPTRHGNDAIAWRTTPAGQAALRAAGPLSA